MSAPGIESVSGTDSVAHPLIYLVLATSLNRTALDTESVSGIDSVGVRLQYPVLIQKGIPDQYGIPSRFSRGFVMVLRRRTACFEETGASVLRRRCVL